MLFKSVLFILIYSKYLKGDPSNYLLRCREQTTAVDQVVETYNQTQLSRKKRFVLFPEFINYLDNWNYLQRTKKIFYWIANFYPKKIDTDYIHHCIQDVIRQINTVIDNEITVQPATDPGEANFHFNLFDYTKCPIDDLPEATIDHMQILDPLLIYPVEVVRKSRYRAHGGIHLVENNRPISTIKFNMQQTFLMSKDFIYDPIIYTCDDETNQCIIDFYWALLHETLHGFGIEHTTNAQEPIPPNAHMQSVMHFSNFRVLCHDDIRAIRAVYNLTIKRGNAIHDDTCRRDFPMSILQKFMYLIGRWIIYLSILFLIISFLIFIFTLLIRYLLSKRGEKQSATKSSVMKDGKARINKNKPQGYLWHDDMI